MRLGVLYRLVRDRFRAAGLETADLDARLLVTATLDLPVAAVVLREEDVIAADAIALVEDRAARRLAGCPVGRILGEREFYGRLFRLAEATLEPRPDTEILVDAVLAREDAGAPVTFCDIGTGTGIIAVTLLAEAPDWRAVAVDLAEEALTCAARNAALHGVAGRLLPVRADFTGALKPAALCRPGEGFDWVISNPPYIRSDVLPELAPEVRFHDPLLALDGGADGLDAYRRIVFDARQLLRSGGCIGLEIGFDQAGDVEKLLRHHGFGEIEIIGDLSGNARVVIARQP